MHDKNLLSSSAHIFRITLFCRGTILSSGSQRGNIQALRKCPFNPSESGEKLTLVQTGRPRHLCLGIQSGSKCRSAEACRGWEQSLLNPPPQIPKHTHTHTKAAVQLVQVIPDFLEGAKEKIRVKGNIHTTAGSLNNQMNMSPWLPAAFRLNAPSGVKWNKWDERGGHRETERERAPKQREGDRKD